MPPDQTSNRPTLTDMPSVGAIRVWLRFGDHDVEVAPGESILGRSPKCQLVLDDPLVSRQHARLVVNRGAVTIEDLGSSNGVLVNGERLARARVLVSGDRVVIGHQTFMLLSAEANSAEPNSRKERIGAMTLSGPRSEPVPPTRQEPPERTEATRKGHALELLGSVAEKVLALGRGDEAERILASYLRNFLQASKVAGEVVDTETADKAALYAVRIAEATGKGIWVDYAFELYTAAKRPLPNVVVEKLYECLRKLSPVSINVFRQYLAALRAVEPQLGPSDRFVLRRIEGLESLGVLK